MLVYVYGKCECFVMQMLYVVSCVHPMAVLNAAFCISSRLLILIEDVRGDHLEEAYSRAVSVFFCLPHPVNFIKSI